MSWMSREYAPDDTIVSAVIQDAVVPALKKLSFHRDVIDTITIARLRMKGVAVRIFD